MWKSRGIRKRITLQMTQEITNERYGYTFNYWSYGTLSEFKERSRDLPKRMQGKGIWTPEITDDFEKNIYRPTNLKNIRETCRK